MKYNLTYGERLRNAREAAGMSQTQLAEACGTTQQTVDRAEKAAKPTSYNSQFAVALNVDHYELATGKINPVLGIEEESPVYGAAKIELLKILKKADRNTSEVMLNIYKAVNNKNEK